MSGALRMLATVCLLLSAGPVSRLNAQTPPGPATLKAVDDRGVDVELERRPQRLVSLAPSNTELLFALGLGPLLVGVTEYCDYPAEAVSIAHVASYSDLSVERVMAAKPDLVVAARGNDLEGLRSLQQLGIPTFAVDTQTIPSLLGAVARLGRLIGVEAAADSLANHLRARVEGVHESVRGRPGGHRPKVMWGYWSDPIYTAGPGSLIDHLIHEAGGINVAAEAPVRWPQISLESVVAWAPEVLVTTHLPAAFAGMPAEIETLRSSTGWRSIPAVRNGHVYHIEADLLTRPGPRIVEGLEQLAAILEAVTLNPTRPVD